MKNNNLEKISKWLLYLVPILPLLFIDGYFYPFVIFRTIYFRIIIVALLAISAYLLYKEPDFIRRFNLRKDKLLNLFGLFVLVMFLAAVFGWNFYNSFFSTFERMEGVAYWIFMLLYYVMLRVYLVNKEDWLKMFKWSYIVSLLVSLYAIFQKFSWIDVFHSGIDRAEGTIGNPAFLGSYLLLMVALGVWIFMIEQDKKWRYGWAVIGAVNLFTLFLTLTRSSILGLFVFAILSLLMFNFYFKSKKYRIFSLSIFISAILFVISIFVFRENLLALDNPFINRILDISLDSPVIKNRILVWQGTLANWSDYIWTGLGIGNFNTLFNKFYTPAINEDWFDKTHNAFLDMLVASGILGLLSYLALYLYPIKLLFAKRKEMLFAVIAIALFVAYAVNNLFVFDTLNTSFLIVIILAFISYLSFRVDQEVVPPNYKKHILSVSAILFSVFSLYYLIYDPFVINRNTYNGYSNIANNKSVAYDYFEKIAGKKYASSETAKQLLDSYEYMISRNPSEENKLRFFDLTKNAFEFARTVYPRDIRLNLHLAQLFINSYNQEENLLKAEPLIKEAIERSPYRAEPYYLLGQLYIRLGQEDRAIEVMQEYSDKLPDYPDPLFILANITYSKDKELARQYFEKAIKLPYVENNLNYKRIIEFLLNEEDFERVEPYYEILVNKNPDNYSYRIDLMQVYYINGRLEDAVEQITLIQNNDPAALKDYQDKVDIIMNEYNNR